MRIGFLSKHNPFDRNAFSGTAFYMHRALCRLPMVNVSVLGGHRRPTRIGSWLERSRGRRAVIISHRELHDVDVVFSLASTDLIPAAARLTCAPVVHVTDATPNLLRELHGLEIPRTRDEAEQQALEAATVTIYSSQYMADRAILEFGDRFAEKIAVSPFGVNLDDLPEHPTPKPDLSPLRLLFVAKVWEKKGGPLALDTLRTLRQRGIEARLAIIGVEPANVREEPGVDVLGFLDKNRPDQMRRMRSALEEAHFLILPTKADCTPMVVAEANSYSMPVLISDIGGIRTLMQSGINGFTLSPMATGADYADRIQELARDAETYSQYSNASFAHYRERLNWDAWAKRALAIVDPYIKRTGYVEGRIRAS